MILEEFLGAGKERKEIYHVMRGMRIHVDALSGNDTVDRGAKVVRQVLYLHYSVVTALTHHENRPQLSMNQI